MAKQSSTASKKSSKSDKKNGAVTETAVPAPVRRHESPRVLLEALQDVEGRINKYFDRSIAAGEIPQDALEDIKALDDLGKYCEELRKSLKVKLAAHSTHGGAFAPGKICVRINTFPKVTVPWKEEWAKAETILANLRGEPINLEAREASVKLAYPSKTETRVEIIVGA